MARKKRPDEEALAARVYKQAGMLAASKTASPYDDLYAAGGTRSGIGASIAIIQKATGGVLPTRLTWSLSNLNLQNKDLLRYAKRAARMLELPTTWVWGKGDMADMKDPLWGGKLRLSTVRRVTQTLEPFVIAGLLPGLVQGKGPDAERIIAVKSGAIIPAAKGPEPLAEVKVKDLSKMVEAIGKHARTTPLSVTEGLSAAIQLIRRGIKPSDLERNLAVVVPWATGRQGAIPGSDLTLADFPMQLLIAAQATADGKKLRSATDVVAYVAGLQPETSFVQTHPTAPITRGRGETPEGALTEITRQTSVNEQLLQQLATTKSKQWDFFLYRDALEKKLKYDRGWFWRTWVGKGLSFVGNEWNKLYTEMEQGASQVSAPVMAGLYSLADLVPGVKFRWRDAKGVEHETADGGWSAAFKQRDQVFRDLAAGKHFGQQFVEDTGLPHWMGVPLDFIIQWQTDPFIVFGKSVTATRSLDVAEGVLGKPTLARAVAQKVPGLERIVEPVTELNRPVTFFDVRTGRLVHSSAEENFAASVEALANGRRGTSLFDAAYAGDHEFVTELSKYATHVEARTPFDHAYMTAARDELLTRFPAKSEEARAAWSEAVAGGFGMPVAQDSIAAKALTLKALQGEDSFNNFVKALPTSTLNGTEYRINAFGEAMSPEELARSVLGPEGATLDMVRALPTQIRLEAPYRLRPVPGGGMTRLAIREFAASDFAANPVGARIVATFNTPPASIFRLHENPQQYIARSMRDWEQFTPAEISERVLEMSRIQTSGTGFEARLTRAVDKVQEEGALRYARSRGFPESLMDDLGKQLREFSGEINRKRVFGVLREPGTKGRVEVFDHPLLETDLANEHFVIPAVKIKNLVDSYTGTLQSLKDQWLKLTDPKSAFKLRGAPAASLAEVKTSELAARLDASKEAWKQAVRVWKFSVVPRPGYIGRVILLDETGRWFGSGMSLFERMAATNMEEATRVLAKAYANPVPFVPGGRAAARGVEKVGAAAGKVTDLIVGRVLDHLYPDELRTLSIGEDTVQLVSTRPGRHADEIFANTAWRESEQVDQMIRSTIFRERAFAKGTFDAVAPGQPLYYQSWTRALRDQFGLSEPGREALRSVAAGESIEQTRAALLTYARQHPGIVSSRIGFTPAEFGQWSEDVARLAHAYTLSDPLIAKAALGRFDTLEETLRAVPKTVALPDVHGPTIAMKLGTERNVIRDYVDFWYDTFVRQPENVLNRQPYYKAWKARAERAYMKMLGTEDLTPAMANSIDIASRNFALAQVKKIMFDFTEDMRLGQMLGSVFPFTQPFFEAYAAWGHIFLHRNPALAGYVRQLMRLGNESGFIRRNPDTGEQEIPTSWWMGQGAIISQLAGMPGIGAVTPISSLNLFFSSSFNLPKEGFIGSLAGGAPIPAPGLAPWVAIPLKAFYKDDRSSVLSSYLYQFGPSTPVLPASWEKMATALKPEWFDEDALQSYRLNVAKHYQYIGLLDEWKSEGVPPEEIEARIDATTRKLYFLKGFFGLWQLGATRLTYNYTEAEQQMWDLRRKYGFEDGTKRFLQEHPDLTLLTVGKTVFGAGIKNPVTGELLKDADGNVVKTGIGIPMSDFAKQLLSVPDIKQVAEDYPSMVGALILDSDPEVANRFSFPVMAEMLANGTLHYKSLADFMAQGEAISTGVSGERGFWEAITLFYNGARGYEVRQAQLESKGLGGDSAKMLALEQEQQAFLGELLHRYPFLAGRYIQPIYDPAKNDRIIGGQWRVPVDSIGNPSWVILANLRSFAAEPKIQEFEAVRGLNLYFYGAPGLPGRDDIAKEMSRRGLTSIDQITAGRAGVTQQYDALVSAVREQYPSAAPFLNIFLDNDLKFVPNAAQQRIKGWAESNDPRYDTYEEFNTAYLKYLHSQRWDDLRDLVNRQYSSDPKMVKTWWSSQSYYWQQERMQSLQTLSPLYYSRWDWHLQGVKLTNKAAGWLSDVTRWRSEVFARDERAKQTGQDYSVGPGLEAIDAWVQEHTKKDASFAAAVDHVNTWGWTLHKFTNQDGKLGQSWSAVLDAAASAQREADRLGLHGLTYDSGPRRALYAKMRMALSDIIKEYSKWSSAFEQQWKQLDENYDGDPLDLLMPETYYAFGKVGD